MGDLYGPPTILLGGSPDAPNYGLTPLNSPKSTSPRTESMTSRGPSLVRDAQTVGMSDVTALAMVTSAWQHVLQQCSSTFSLTTPRILHCRPTMLHAPALTITAIILRMIMLVIFRNAQHQTSWMALPGVAIEDIRRTQWHGNVDAAATSSYSSNEATRGKASPIFSLSQPISEP